jgi:hypothetical protein
MYVFSQCFPNEVPSFQSWYKFLSSIEKSDGTEIYLSYGEALVILHCNVARKSLRYAIEIHILAFHPNGSRVWPRIPCCAHVLKIPRQFKSTAPKISRLQGWHYQ